MDERIGRFYLFPDSNTLAKLIYIEDDRYFFFMGDEVFTVAESDFVKFRLTQIAPDLETTPQKDVITQAPSSEVEVSVGSKTPLKFGNGFWVIVGLVFIVGWYYFFHNNQKCIIKGNISKNGTKIFHVPGDKYYDKVKIEPEKGEKYFCNLEEAEEDGFRPSGI
jgi:hypothetical protein